MTVVLALYISTKLKIDSLLCDEGKILGSRLLKPATKYSLVRVASTLDEALGGCNKCDYFVHGSLSYIDRDTAVFKTVTEFCCFSL